MGGVHAVAGTSIWLGYGWLRCQLVQPAEHVTQVVERLSVAGARLPQIHHAHLAHGQAARFEQLEQMGVPQAGMGAGDSGAVGWQGDIRVRIAACIMGWVSGGRVD